MTRYGLEHIGRHVHLTTLGGRRDGATLCGATGRPSARKIRGTCQRCASWSRVIQTLRTLATPDEQTTPYDHARDGL
jgi:hypothetical protein